MVIVPALTSIPGFFDSTTLTSVSVPGRGKRSWARHEHRQGASLKFKDLIRPRHFDTSAGKMCRELPHDVLFAVNKERTFRAGLFLPRQQLSFVGMGGKPIDGVDASLNRDVLTKDSHLLSAVDNTARESSKGCVADEHDARILATQIVLQVVAHAAAGAHA